MFSVTVDRLTAVDADALAVPDELADDEDDDDDDDEQPAAARAASASVRAA
jgi:hypothetical protein